MSGQKIETIYAFIATEKNGTEGIISMQVGDMHMPFVSADDCRLEWLKPYALQIAKESGTTVTLAKFSVRENIEELK